MIWEYRDATGSDEHTHIGQLYGLSICGGGNGRLEACPFCDSVRLETLSEDQRRWIRSPDSTRLRMKAACHESDHLTVYVCGVCGWWHVLRRRESCEQISPGTQSYSVRHGAVFGVLKQLDVADVSAPTEELVRYLLARYHERFRLNPKKFEEIVGSIFSTIGYSVRVTGHSREDEGIDVVLLDGPSDAQVGIQVKRFKRSIKAEMIRSLSGALTYKGMTQGIFVTTSSFQRGAIRSAHRYRQMGQAIHFMDANAFYDRMQLAVRPMYTDPHDPSAPFSKFLRDPEKIAVYAEDAPVETGLPPELDQELTDEEQRQQYRSLLSDWVWIPEDRLDEFVSKFKHTLTPSGYVKIPEDRLQKFLLLFRRSLEMQRQCKDKALRRLPASLQGAALDVRFGHEADIEL